MKIESLEEALAINALTVLPLKIMLTEKMLKMTEKQYNCICPDCKKG